MDTIQRLLPQGLPVSLQVVAATLLLGFIYSIITKERPFSAFPVIALDGKSARKTWLFNGRKAMIEGVRRVCCGNDYVHETYVHLLTNPI